MVSINKELQITNIFLVNWATIIFTNFFYVIFFAFKKNQTKRSKISFYFRIQVLSRYMFWASTYICFWAFYELLNICEIVSSKVVSYIATSLCVCAWLAFIYWFVIYSNKEWCIWNKYPQMNAIRTEFLLLNSIEQENYILIIRYNFVRKLVLTMTYVVQLKLMLSPFIFTFLVIFIQTIYSNIIIGLWQFNSPITRGLLILNEIFMVEVIILAAIEYLNQSFALNSDLNQFEMIMLFTIRLHIMLIIIIESSRIFLFIIRSLISEVAKWIRKKPQLNSHN